MIEAAAAEKAREMAQEVLPIAVPKPPPAAALASTPPRSHPGSSSDPVVVPSKTGPKLPATVAPNPYRDIYRYPAGAALPSPEFEAEFDAQKAKERAARLVAAWQNRPKSPLEPPKPKRDPPIPSAEVVEAFIAGQRSMGKGKGLASPFPQAWGAKGKGKAKSADPFVGLDGRGHFRGREASRDRDGFKRGRHGFYEREGPSTCAGRPLATQRSTATAPARSASARLRTA